MSIPDEASRAQGIISILKRAGPKMDRLRTPCLGQTRCQSGLFTKLVTVEFAYLTVRKGDVIDLEVVDQTVVSHTRIPVFRSL